MLNQRMAMCNVATSDQSTKKNILCLCNFPVEELIYSANDPLLNKDLVDV